MTVLLTSVPDTERALAADAFAEARVTSEPFSRAVAEAHADARVLCVAYSDRVTPEALAMLPRLKAVVTRSDGFDHLPASWLAERGLPGYHLGGYATASVAEFAVMLLVALLRRVPESASRTRGAPDRDPSWVRRGLEGRSLGEVTVGVLGTGRIGSRVARHVTALGGTVVGFDVAPDPALVKLDGFRYADDFPALLAASDALTVHVPLAPGTRGLVDADAIARLPAGAVLVNTARGPVVDQAAVADALASAHLAGYAADVLPGEPAPAEDLARFAGHANVLLTPHVASYDHATLRARYGRAAGIARAVIEGRGEDVAQWRCIP